METEDSKDAEQLSQEIQKILSSLAEEGLVEISSELDAILAEITI